MSLNKCRTNVLDKFKKGRITTTFTFQDLLSYLQQIEDKSSIAVYIDFDDCIINAHTDEILELDIARKLFDYMTQNDIIFRIVTGRYQDTVCNNTTRNLYDMERCIRATMFPIFEELGLNVDEHKNEQKTCHLVLEDDKTVGILYMGIYFGGNKGSIINYDLQQLKEDNYDIKHKIFIDDYEPYLKSVMKYNPDMISFRRRY